MSQKRCKECNVKILGYNPPDLCNKCKPMQNNETKWEEEFQMKYCGELYKQEVSEDFRGFRGCYDEVKDFISQEIEKAYQEGREEGRGENLSTTESITETLEIPKTIIHTLRLQTLEEVEKVINIIPNTNLEFDPYASGGIQQFKDFLLQQLNKLKENDPNNS